MRSRGRSIRTWATKGSSVSIHWHGHPTAAVRLHAGGGGYGEPYHWCATLEQMEHEGEPAAWITGIDRPLSGDEARLIGAACYVEGFAWIGWERTPGGRPYWRKLPHPHGAV